MGKPTKATRYIREAAKRCSDSGVTVDITRNMPWVAIDAPGEDGVFMQGDNAEKFVAEVDALCRRYPSLDESTAALAIAESYVDCIFN